MAKNPQPTDTAWVASLTTAEAFMLLGWLGAAAEEKPEIAAEFARFAARRERLAAEAEALNTSL
jgi:hypothetical protein